MLTQERLKELLEYDETTGVFVWRKTIRAYIQAGRVAGTTHKTGYRVIIIDGAQHKVHRLVWLYVHGVFPPEQIDHIDGVRDNNKLNNLRAVTKAQNAQNIRDRDTASGHRGVTWHAGKWQVRATSGGVKHTSGYFSSLEGAVEEAQALRNRVFTHNVEQLI